jgi:hypothetical protein
VKEQQPDVLAACAAVASSAGEYAAAKNAAIEAQDAEREARRKMNRMQRDFDLMYAEMRRTAPPESHWGRAGAFCPPVWDETDC